MTAQHSCPSCGDTESLRGEEVGGDIRVGCRRCGHSWLRGELRCRTCGGSDLTDRPQVMSRQPRGNQLSIVGRRVIVLCRVCDDAALTTSLTRNAPVPEGYVSAAMLSASEVRLFSTPQDRSTDSPAGGTAPRDQVPRATPQARRERGTPDPPRSVSPGRAEVPTTRQAVQDYLATAGSSADSTAVLMLATHLGAATRLSTLDRPEAPEDLRAWFTSLWGQASADRQAEVLTTLTAALDHWRRAGWVSQDAGARLRDDSP